jgi:hypothetical protein
MLRAGLLAVLFATAGCSGGQKSHHIRGTVKYGGEMLPRGIIRFEPDPRTGNDGPEGYAMIIDGQFDTRLELGKPVISGGGFVIRIDGNDGKPGNELPMGKPLFSGHTEVRTLEAADQELHFDIPKK